MWLKTHTRPFSNGRKDFRVTENKMKIFLTNKITKDFDLDHQCILCGRIDGLKLVKPSPLSYYFFILYHYNCPVCANTPITDTTLNQISKNINKPRRH